MSDLLRSGKRGAGMRARSLIEIQAEETAPEPVRRKPQQSPSKTKPRPQVSPFEDALSFVREASSRPQVTPETWEKALDIAEKLSATAIDSPFEVMDFFLNARPDVDSFLHLHAVNVAILSSLLWHEVSGSDEDLRTVCAMALVHDFGMFDLDWELVHGGKLLNEEERIEIKHHPQYTSRKVEPVRAILPEDFFRSISASHERSDGSGYPDGLHDHEIGLPGRIFQVADVFEAATHERPHKEKALSPHEGIAVIVKEAKEGRLDKSIVRAIIDAISAHPMGSAVNLSDGRQAVVIAPNPGFPFRPLVRTSSGQIVDLKMNPAIRILI